MLNTMYCTFFDRLSYCSHCSSNCSTFFFELRGSCSRCFWYIWCNFNVGGCHCGRFGGVEVLLGELKNEDIVEPSHDRSGDVVNLGFEIHFEVRGNDDSGSTWKGDSPARV
jgi:hypothetical protein